MHGRGGERGHGQAARVSGMMYIIISAMRIRAMNIFENIFLPYFLVSFGFFHGVITRCTVSFFMGWDGRSDDSSILEIWYYCI